MLDANHNRAIVEDVFSLVGKINIYINDIVGHNTTT